MFLVKHGFCVKKRNYLRRVGEIDVIAQKNEKLYFIEVKTFFIESVSCETFRVKQNIYLPEENVCESKIRKMIVTAELFLLENNLKDREVEFGVISVVIGKSKKILRIRYIGNVNIN